MKDFALWLGARLLMVLGTTFAMLVGGTAGIGKPDMAFAAQLLWVVLLSVVCYGGGIACYLTRKTTDHG